MLVSEYFVIASSCAAQDEHQQRQAHILPSNVTDADLTKSHPLLPRIRDGCSIAPVATATLSSHNANTPANEESESPSLNLDLTPTSPLVDHFASLPAARPSTKPPTFEPKHHPEIIGGR